MMEVEVARASLLGGPVHGLSPLVAAMYLLCAMLNVEPGAFQRFAMKWTVLVYLLMTAGALLSGAITFRHYFKVGSRRSSVRLRARRAARAAIHHSLLSMQKNFELDAADFPDIDFQPDPIRCAVSSIGRIAAVRLQPTIREYKPRLAAVALGECR